MSDFILTHEPALRLGAFVGVLALMALWEAARPRRPRALPRWLRWSNNLALVAVDTLVLRLLVPMLAVGLAMTAEAEGWGLLNMLAVPAWLAIPLAVLALDLVVYLQHVMFHAVPALWRLHRMHHADTDIDVTTGLRFHPFEIVLSMVVKLAAVLVLGPPVVAVVLFEVLLNATALFNHANLRLPAAVDRWLRLIVVTPDMHRVHHSVRPEETHSNFGFNMPWWDRLLGTYRAQPRDGHDGMTIGLAAFRAPREAWLDRLLMQPFRRSDGPPSAPSD